jgi:hypothetical protein
MSVSIPTREKPANATYAAKATVSIEGTLEVTPSHFSPHVCPGGHLVRR